MEVAEEFGEAEGEGESPGGEAAHGDHEGEPAAVGVRALFGDSAEEGVHEHGGENPGEEDE